LIQASPRRLNIFLSINRTRVVASDSESKTKLGEPPVNCTISAGRKKLVLTGALDYGTTSELVNFVGGLHPDSQNARSEMAAARKVLIVGPPVQVLDIAGPLEVFSNAEPYDVTIGSPGPERALQTNRRFALTGAVPIKEINCPIDTLVIAGGPGAETGVYDSLLVR
jgi:hypothetical protein